jgi:WD40 repeat protein
MNNVAPHRKKRGTCDRDIRNSSRGSVSAEGAIGTALGASASKEGGSSAAGGHSETSEEGGASTLGGHSIEESQTPDSSKLFSFGDFQVQLVDELMNKEDITGIAQAAEWDRVSKRVKSDLNESRGYKMLRSVDVAIAGTGLPNKIKSVDVSGQLLVACCTDDHHASIFHLAMNFEVGHLTGQTNIVTHICTSEGGQLMATAIRDGTVLVWDPATLRRLWRLSHFTSISALAMSPDAAFLVVCTQDRVCRIWAMKTGRVVRVCESHRGAVLSVKLTSAPSFRLFTGSVDRTVNVHLLSEAEPLRFTRHANPVISVDYILPDIAKPSTPAMQGDPDSQPVKKNCSSNGNAGSGGGVQTSGAASAHSPPGFGHNSPTAQRNSVSFNSSADPSTASTPDLSRSSSSVIMVLSADAQRILYWNSETLVLQFAFDVQSLVPLTKALTRVSTFSCIGALLCPPPLSSYIFIPTNHRVSWIIHIEGREPPIPVFLRSFATASSRRGNTIVIGDHFGNLYTLSLK